MNLQGKISISRDSNDTVRIEIIEALSSIRFVDVKMTPEEFGHCVTGGSFTRCELDIRGLDKVGKLRVTKQEYVPCRVSATDEEISKALATFEVDGWHGYRSDIGNMHRWNSNRNAFNVTFERWVDAPKKD